MRVFILPIIILLSSCQPHDISSPHDGCAILKNRGWYSSAAASERSWGIDISTQLAVIYQESSFKHTAKTDKAYKLWIIPWGHVSTAYGYPQAMDAIWNEYLDERGGILTSRTRFKDATDFIGWYLNKIASTLNIPKGDVKRLYIAYHEGIAGYRKGSYKKNKRLIKVAEKVASRARAYNNQLKECRFQLSLNSLFLG